MKAGLLAFGSIDLGRARFGQAQDPLAPLPGRDVATGCSSPTPVVRHPAMSSIAQSDSAADASQQ